MRENGRMQTSETPMGWRKARCRHKEVEARWMKKHGRHAMAQVPHQRRHQVWGGSQLRITLPGVHDSQFVEAFLDETS